jgi:hypothetical protein
LTFFSIATIETQMNADEAQMNVRQDLVVRGAAHPRKDNHVLRGTFIWVALSAFICVSLLEVRALFP